MFNADVKTVDKEISEQINMIAATAKNCLSLEQFKTYRKQYESAEEKMVQAMLMLTESFNAGRLDLTTYGSKMLVYMTRLKDLRMLLDTITNDAKKVKTDD
jgi:hypothetical protein